jgi:DNA (cytosine-5)-methyltransferase 1
MIIKGNNTEPIKFFSMFAGIGGFEKGFPDNWNCVGYSEIDKYAMSVYRYHYPNHKNYGNAKHIIPGELPDFDILCGGFPCQDYSVAGKGAGLEGARGTLFYEIARICKAKKPRCILLENVGGLLNKTHRQAFITILTILSDIGYRVEWELLNSKYFAIPQNRERVFILCTRGTRLIRKRRDRKYIRFPEIQNVRERSGHKRGQGSS